MASGASSILPGSRGVWKHGGIYSGRENLMTDLRNLGSENCLKFGCALWTIRPSIRPLAKEMGLA
jgi:hypothetical protein